QLLLLHACLSYTFLFFFTPPASPEISPLSLHDALPICDRARSTGCHHHGERGADHPGALLWRWRRACHLRQLLQHGGARRWQARSEEHTSELQSRSDLVCRLLLEKKKKIKNISINNQD